MPADFTEEDVRRKLDPAALIVAIEDAFRDRFPTVGIPSRIHLPLAEGVFLAMSCYDGQRNTLGIKLVTVQNNPDREKGGVHATYMLLDPATSKPRLTIDANALTDLRTAATSAVATKFLARGDARTLGIFGTGRLALAHLQLLPLVRKFQRVLICGRTAARANAFIDRIHKDFPHLDIAPTDPQACAKQSDVICTCTASPTPLFDGRDLGRGIHLNLTGAYLPDRRETDTHTIRQSRIVVDTQEALTSGDINIPQREGAITSRHIAGNLHELLSGKTQGRRTQEETTIFKSVGCPLEDIVAAELLQHEDAK